MDNDEDMVDRAAKYIFYIIYNETSLSGLIMAFVGGWGIFYRITKSDSNGVENWPQNRLSRVRVGRQDFCFLHFYSYFKVRQTSDLSRNR